MHLQENTSFDLVVKVPRNIAEYHLHHMTYAPTKFEAAISNGLEDAIKRKPMDICACPRHIIGYTICRTMFTEVLVFLGLRTINLLLFLLIIYTLVNNFFQSYLDRSFWDEPVVSRG